MEYNANLAYVATIINLVGRREPAQRRGLERSAHMFLSVFSAPRMSFLASTCRPGDARKVLSLWRRGAGLVDGKYVGELEQAFSRYYDDADITAFGAGRMACYAILKALKLKEGDEIILPGYTCIVVPNAIIRMGLKPVYADVSLDDYNMLPEAAERLITPRTKAIIAQHTFGIPNNMDAIGDIGRRHGLPVIEDCAHSFGARFRGRLTGLWGTAGFLSTQQNKMLTTMEGGFVITNDRQLAAAVRETQAAAQSESPRMAKIAMFRWCYDSAVVRRPWAQRLFRIPEIICYKINAGWSRDLLLCWSDRYAAEMNGQVYEPFPTKLPNILAYTGLLQLPRMEGEIEHRNELASYLMGELPKLGAKVPKYDPSISRPSWPRFPFTVDDLKPWCRSLLRCRFIPGRWLQGPIGPAECHWHAASYREGMCPNAEYLSRHVINVPVDSRISVKMLHKWISSVGGFLAS